jgi:hypothetical protein
MDIKTGQVLEFVEPVTVEGRVIERGTRVRVGYIEPQVMESKLTLVVLGTEKSDTIVVDHHVAGIHCRIVSQPG